MSKNNSNSLSKRVSKFIIVISALGIVIALWVNGYANVQLMAIFLIFAAAGAAIDSTLVRLVLALFSLGFLIYQITGYDYNEFKSLIAPVTLLLILLFGYFVIFGGLRKK